MGAARQSRRTRHHVGPLSRSRSRCNAIQESAWQASGRLCGTDAGRRAKVSSGRPPLGCAAPGCGAGAARRSAPPETTERSCSWSRAPPSSRFPGSSRASVDVVRWLSGAIRRGGDVAARRIKKATLVPYRSRGPDGQRRSPAARGAGPARPCARPPGREKSAARGRATLFRKATWRGSRARPQLRPSTASDTGARP